MEELDDLIPIEQQLYNIEKQQQQEDEQKQLQPFGTYGYLKEKEENKNRATIENYQWNRDIFAENSFFKKVETKAGRAAEADAVFKKMEAEANTLLKLNYSLAYKSGTLGSEEGIKSAFINSVDQVAFMEQYSQTGVLDGVYSTMYEHTLAQKCEQEDSSKHTRKRKAKREKVLNKQKAALEAANNMAYRYYQNDQTVRGELDDTAKAATKEMAVSKYEAQKEYMEALMEAEAYDNENNIKMARSADNKRLIDMGDGTSDYFAGLAKIRSNKKILDANKLLKKDAENAEKEMSEAEVKRARAKNAAFDKKIKAIDDNLYSDVKTHAKRLPELIYALEPKYRDKKYEITEMMNELRMDDFIKIIDTFMGDPLIISCIRKDIRALEATGKYGEAFNPEEAAFRELGHDLVRDLALATGKPNIDI